MAWTQAQTLNGGQAVGSAASLTATFGSNVVAGNRVLIFVASFGVVMNTPTSVPSLTWTQLVTETQNSAAAAPLTHRVYTAVVATTGSLQITVTNPAGAAGDELGWTAGEYSGLDASSGSGSLRTSQTAAGNSDAAATTSVTTGTSGADLAGDLAIVCYADWGASLTITAPGGYSKQAGLSRDAAANIGQCVATKIATGTTEGGTFTYTSTAVTNEGLVLAIKLAPASSGLPFAPGPVWKRYFAKKPWPVFLPGVQDVVVAATVAATQAVVVQKPKLFPRRSLSRIAPQTPTAVPTLARTVLKRRVKGPSPDSLVAPQTPTVAATSAKTVLKRKVRAGAPESLVAPVAPATVRATQALVEQKGKILPLRPRTAVAPQTPTTAATSVVAKQKRPVKPLEPTALVALAAQATVAATGSVALQKRRVKPQRPFPLALVAPQTPTTAATSTVADQKPTLRRRVSSSTVRTVVTAGVRSTNTVAIQKRERKVRRPKPFNVGVAGQTPTVRATVAAKVRLKSPLRASGLKTQVRVNPPSVTEGCVEVSDGLRTGLVLSDFN